MAHTGCSTGTELSALSPARKWRNSSDGTTILDPPMNWEEDSTLPVSVLTVELEDRNVERVLSLESLCDNVQQLRSFDEEDSKHFESLFLVGYDAVYISEEEGVQKSTDMCVLQRNLEEKNVIAECVQSIKRLKRLNTDLQKSLDLSEDGNSVLRTENTALKNQIKILKQFTQDDHLKDELDAILAAKLEQEQICSALEAIKKKLEKENDTLKDQNEAIASEMANILAEKEMCQKKSEELGQIIMALQQEVEETGLHLVQTKELMQEKDMRITQLEDTVSEYRTITQDMKEKIQDLEGQLALALVNGSGCYFMNTDTGPSADVQHPVSLGEELGLLPECQMKFTSDEKEENTDENDKDECNKEKRRNKFEENNDENDNEECNTEKKGTRNEENINENDKEECNAEKRGTRNEENKDENGKEECNMEKKGTQNEEYMVEIEKVEHTEEAKTVEVENSLPHYHKRWLLDCYECIKRAAHVAGVFGFGFLVSLGLLKGLVHVHCDSVGPSCTDFVWIIIRRLIEPYCSIQHIGLPPL